MAGAADAAAALARIADELPLGIDEGISAALDHLIDDLRAVNPVRTGRMKRGWEAAHVGPGHWLLQDEAPYSGYVVGGTRHMRPNAALGAVLDRAELDIEAALDVAITRVVRG